MSLMTGVRRLMAGFALLALLACSSAGICWMTLAGTVEHGCCDEPAPCEEPSASMNAGTAPCTSPLAPTLQVQVLPPSITSAPPVEPAATFISRNGGAHGPAFRPVGPPLILRI